VEFSLQKGRKGVQKEKDPARHAARRGKRHRSTLIMAKEETGSAPRTKEDIGWRMGGRGEKKPPPPQREKRGGKERNNSLLSR